jgi:plasmid replication initiation protein
MLAEKKIKKHVAIIHAYSLMSVLQRKIFNVLLYEAIKGDSGLHHKESISVECRIPFYNVCKAVKFNSNNTQYLKEAIDGLASLKIEWNLLKDKVPTDISFLNLRVLHGSPTFFQDNTLNFSFHKVMLDLIDNPSIYGTVDLEIQSQFESKYGHALYENATRFVNLQKNKIIQLETFRRLLGVREDKYPSMRELTRNVISPAVEEVNDRADFTLKAAGIKIGRKISAFELAVKSKKKVSIDITANALFDEKLAKEVRQTFGILNEIILKNIFNKYSAEYILEKIAYTKKYARKEQSGLYPIPYFISALRDNYKLNENHLLHEIQEEIPNQKCQWKETLYYLQSDFEYWKKTLEQEETAKNSLQVSNIKKILLRCEEKLKQHISTHPMPQEPV